jgi:hypothetical protein
MNNQSASFVIDSTLGRLTKWLRVMGCDAYYHSELKKIEIEQLLEKGRILLTKNRTLKSGFTPSILILSDKIQDQLIEINKHGLLPATNQNWFKRCIKCNTPLKSLHIKDAQGRIPEYIISQNIEGIHHCSSCNRYFWPGSHRIKMLRQIKEWGLLRGENTTTPTWPNDTNPFGTKKNTCD